MEIIVQNHYENMQCRIYLKEEYSGEDIFFSWDGENFIKQKLSANGIEGQIKPLIVIPMAMKDELLKAFINEGSKSNLRTDNENLLKGKLEAVELHLNDMREFSRELLYSKLKS